MQTVTAEKQAATAANGRSAGFNFAHLAARAAEGKMLAEDFAEIGKRKAQRMIRRGRDVGEDYLDETTHYIKHHPWQSMGVAMGVGLSLGFLGGFLTKRN